MDVRIQDCFLLRGLNLATANLDGTFEDVQATGAEVIQEPMDQGYCRDAHSAIRPGT